MRIRFASVNGFNGFLIEPATKSVVEIGLVISKLIIEPEMESGSRKVCC